MLSFKDRQHFAHRSDHVLAHYRDADFILSKHRALGHQDIVVLEHEVQDESMRLRVSFMHSLDVNLPEFARRFMKKRTQVIQTLEWNVAERRGRIRVDAKGAPLQIEGLMHLADCPGGCVASVSWEVHCPVPILGARLESLLQETMTRMTLEDQAITGRLLSEAKQAKKRVA
jgi:hypothetical protein